MAEQYRFFDSTDEDVREYRAAEFAEYFATFLSNGIFNADQALRVTANGTNMSVSIEPGFAFIKGYLYKIADEPLVLNLDTADPTHDRIDRVVIRLDFTQRSIRALILKGTPAVNPIPPAIVRNDTQFDLSLAQVHVVSAQSVIYPSQIVDERLDQSLCGMVSSLITIPTDDMWNDWLAKKSEISADWAAWYQNAKAGYNEVAYEANEILIWMGV